VASRATLRIGFVIGDVLVTTHAGCAIGAYLGFVNAMAGLALRVAFALRDTRDAVKPWQLSSFVTAAARGLR
jgi:hypothetical protein